MTSERLQKYMARCGVDSRRRCEQLILDGRVAVNGSVITELGLKIDPEKDVVKVDGRRISAEKTVYYAVNKPTGYVSSSRDRYGRPRVIDLVPDTGRLFTVGRLDVNSWGLIIVTNDGDAAYRLSHPSVSPEKEYHVLLKGQISEEDIKALQSGIILEEGRTSPSKVRILWKRKNRTCVSIIVKQGWYRMVRRMFMSLGKDVRDLYRVRIGNLTLDGIEEEGMWRKLEKEEVERIAENSKKRKKHSRRA